MSERLCVGVVVGAHGIKGQLRIKSFTADPDDLTRYGPLETEAGQAWRLQAVGSAVKGVVVARVAGVLDRNQAEAARGTRLFVRKEALPPAEDDEFYVGDLVGLRAVSPEGAELGRITAVFDFGAGDVIEVKGAAAELLVPFTRQVVPLVDVAGGRVVIDAPRMSEDDAKDASPDGD